MRISNVPPHLSRAAASLPSPPGTHPGCWGQARFVTAWQGVLQVLYTRHRFDEREISAPKLLFRENAGDSLGQGWMGRVAITAVGGCSY